MPFHVGTSITPLINRACKTLGLSQRELGELCETSHRTAQRWAHGKAFPSVQQVQILARALVDEDLELAESMAQEAGGSLLAWGLVEPPPPPRPLAAPPVPAGPPPRAVPPVALMVDSILHAAALAAEDHAADPTSHQAIQAIVRAAFGRARGLGLALSEVDDALAASPVVTPGRAAAKAASSR
jgi:hypothetical protein